MGSRQGWGAHFASAPFRFPYCFQCPALGDPEGHAAARLRHRRKLRVEQQTSLPRHLLLAGPCNADDALLSPPVRLWPADAPRGGAPRLDFWHWADFERDDDTDPASPTIRMWDTGRLEVSADSGATWSPLDPEGGYPAIQSFTASPFPEGTPCFAPVAADLSPLAPDAPSASAPVQIRFRFASDAYVACQGWRVDDVQITPRTLLPSGTNWAALSAAALTLAPGETATLSIAFDAAAFGPMQTDFQFLDLHHNDPRFPSPLPIPLSLSCSDRSLTVSASGPGTALPLGTAVYPAPTNLLLTFTPDPGAILADLQTNGTPAAACCGTDAPATLPVLLESNLLVQATFAPLPPADAPLRLALLPPSGTDTTYRLVWHAYTNPAAAYRLLSATNLLASFEPLQTLPAPPPS